MKKTIQTPADLIDEEISAISFVRDYVEVHFDGPILRSVSNPIVVIKAVEHRFPEPGSRDALCKVIGTTVLAVKLEDGHAFELSTSGGHKIIIPLDTKSRTNPEAMHFVPGLNQPIQVW